MSSSGHGVPFWGVEDTPAQVGRMPERCPCAKCCGTVGVERVDFIPSAFCLFLKIKAKINSRKHEILPPCPAGWRFPIRWSEAGRSCPPGRA